MAAGDVRAVAAGQLAGVPRVAADGGPPLMALRARSCRRRRRRCRGRLRSGARALPAAHAACAAPCPDRWACSMSSARPRHQQDTHHAQSPAVGDVADGLGRPRRGARGRMRREGVGDCHNPSAKNPTTAVRATTVPPFAGTGLLTVGRSGVHRPKRICAEGAGATGRRRSPALR